ncbi:glutaminyl-peptide cyclotransferase [Psychroserpens ponticola]|uniref:Glutaminyl-peptide cyclotransferase n=1 Tax=Psychroserpens ponticola TaxID=2932268 RepID=A0ABY7RU23_9FLAO|nr:glutaminyl-peptide cyclotransferase [Psychroserpens ponticola]WCO00468.1 glutaminyl-peptide cyclotransferase [Psychroserpens ponticola]
MSTFKSLILIALSHLLINCGDSKPKKNNVSIHTNAKDNVVKLGETVKLSVNNPDNLEISSINYTLNGESINESFHLNNQRLGIQTITATIDYGDLKENISTKITILNNELPKIYGYKIINEYPHDITSYTQGLEFHNGELYESTGQYGESKLRKVDYQTAEVLKNVDLTQQYFGEGLTILNNNIYQLTWRENTGFVYNTETFEKTSSFKYGQSKEGWGICNDGTTLYKSDGTENIWLLNPKTLTEDSKLQVYTNRGKITEINEMEWINGKIYANRYQKNGVAIINPKNGAVEGVIDFSPLHKLVTQHQGLDVLNGIAYNPATKTIFVTGKRWDKLFEVEVFEK